MLSIDSQQPKPKMNTQPPRSCKGTYEKLISGHLACLTLVQHDWLPLTKFYYHSLSNRTLTEFQRLLLF